jgi:hypothetical protein
MAEETCLSQAAAIILVKKVSTGLTFSRTMAIYISETALFLDITSLVSCWVLVILFVVCLRSLRHFFV